ncbi:MAG: putative lipid II flippase FtsW [Armatimonadota bacterium]|nr:putative lipid II flippase FtsW [Armatimonadota bacterium]MDR7404044.1 putative lipid II flippase FtsW [Armatimonadota bacterium]MDR7508814.1 putative lipid II flippase FtsW [Armatimonadota bacterium]MDR7517849.1 putative lipid II flippase FtsW [Armatimonadota bacterium]MDR7588167.1 putative lipid II flippase FtsW [Armatimonadota bacterium]
MTGPPRRAPDPWVLVPVVILTGVGVVMVYSASAIVAHEWYGDSAFFLKRQATWAVLGLVALALAQRVHYLRLRPLAPALLAIGAVALVLVLVPGIGRTAGGARRWLPVGGPVSVQPSEGMKLALVLFLADALDRRGSRIGELRAIAGPVAVTAAVFGLILAQPDMGTALLTALVAGGMLFAAGARLRHLVGMGLAALPVVAAAALGEEYRRQRLLAFVNPWADPQGAGFHIIQSLLALGSGGLRGVGLGQSRQKFYYLPERHTDFIFSILGEELGLVGGLSILALYGVLAVRGMRIARTAPDRFGSLLAAGLTVTIVAQAVINIGVTTGVLPITGVPLPLVSFGGSSLLFTMIAAGILLNISQHAGSDPSVRSSPGARVGRWPT